MKIRSKFKDYYDHVGQRFGEDPDVVYSRGRIKSEGYEVDPPRYRGRHMTSGRSSFHHYLRPRDSQRDRTLYSLELLAAGELVFPVVRMAQRTSDDVNRVVSGVVSYRHLDEPTLQWIQGYSPDNKYYDEELLWHIFHEELTKFRPNLEKAQVDLQAPVFLYGEKGIYERVPILREHGIPALVSAQQMWQNVYSIIVNRLRKNPDKAPPVAISERDRIVKAGFDLKTSFRHPVNPKKKGKII
jgi:hypothetical protein